MHNFKRLIYYNASLPSGWLGRRAAQRDWVSCCVPLLSLVWPLGVLQGWGGARAAAAPPTLPSRWPCMLISGSTLASSIWPCAPSHALLRSERQMKEFSCYCVFLYFSFLLLICFFCFHILGIIVFFSVLISILFSTLISIPFLFR